VKRLIVGLLLGLAIGIPVGAGGWWVYREKLDGPGAGERERADELVTRWLERTNCACTLERLEQIDNNVWRATVLYGVINTRVCYRVEIDRFLVQPRGFPQGVRTTACQ
jgi:hypothetical protein